MWSSNGHSDIVSSLRLCDFNLLVAGRMEFDCSLGDQKRLVVHLVPVRRRTGGFGWDYKLSGTEAVVYEGEIAVWQPGIMPFLPVCDPSSIMRMVMGPNLNVSPALTGTKLMGTCGFRSPAGGFSWVAMLSCDDTLY